MSASDDRLANLSRALRRRQGLSQQQVARLAGVPRRDILNIEGGRAGLVLINRVEKAFQALGANARVNVWWNGAAADRLLDERHAGLGERAVFLLRGWHWVALPEVTFSEYGERGSIDILGGHEATRCVLVSEVKASIGSIEETNRRMDVKERHAWKLARDRFGWRPSSISRVLILPEDSTVRRVVRRHAETMSAVYPARGRQFRAWLRNPSGRISALWFLSEIADANRVSNEAARGPSPKLG